MPIEKLASSVLPIGLYEQEKIKAHGSSVACNGGLLWTALHVLKTPEDYIPKLIYKGETLPLITDKYFSYQEDAVFVDLPKEITEIPDMIKISNQKPDKQKSDIYLIGFKNKNIFEPVTVKAIITSGKFEKFWVRSEYESNFSRDEWWRSL